MIARGRCSCGPLRGKEFIVRTRARDVYLFARGLCDWVIVEKIYIQINYRRYVHMKLRTIVKYAHMTDVSIGLECFPEWSAWPSKDGRKCVYSRGWKISMHIHYKVQHNVAHMDWNLPNTLFTLPQKYIYNCFHLNRNIINFTDLCFFYIWGAIINCHGWLKFYLFCIISIKLILRENISGVNTWNEESTAF